MKGYEQPNEKRLTPRQVIAKHQNIRDREMVLRASRKKTCITQSKGIGIVLDVRKMSVFAVLLLVQWFTFRHEIYYINYEKMIVNYISHSRFFWVVKTDEDVLYKENSSQKQKELDSNLNFSH